MLKVKIKIKHISKKIYISFLSIYLISYPDKNIIHILLYKIYMIKKKYSYMFSVTINLLIVYFS